MLRLSLLFLVALAMGPSLIRGEEVETLTSSNFDSFIQTEFAVVEFYAPWCGHCKSLAPHYEKAAGRLKKLEHPVLLGKVDATVENELASKYGVSGYPTLKIFRKGNEFPYEGPREEEGIVKYLSSMSGPATTLLESKSDVEKKRNMGVSTAIIAFVEEGKTMDKFFQEKALSLRSSFKCGHVYSADVANEMGVPMNSIVVYQPKVLNHKWERNEAVYEGDATEGAFGAWMEENGFPIVGVITSDLADVYAERKPLLTVFADIDYRKDPKGSNYFRNRILKVAKDYPDDIVFSLANKGEFMSKIGDLPDVSSQTTVVLIEDKNGKKYYQPGMKFAPEEIKSFADDFVHGKLSPFVKSQEPPANNDGPVTVLTGKTFEELAMNNEKDVLVEFYAPWCGHCKNLEPKYNQVGEKFADNENVVIAKIDATANDYPNFFQVQGFPTIFWLPGKDKFNPQKYEGGREVEDFVEYINSHTSYPLKSSKKKGKKKGKKDEL
eukprot:Nk52_evm7s1762 gene=Nk52_evmTU7s1762